MRNALILAASLTLAVGPAVALGQTGRIMDEGSFTITVNGRTVGRENFRITSNTRGSATEYVARADVTYGDRKQSTELRTEAEGGVVRYVITTRAAGATESWEGDVAAGRLSAKISSARGTSAREYMMTPGALLLDDGVMHQYWFLALRARDGGIPVVVPRQTNVKATVTMTTVGEEQLQIGNHDLASTHLRAAVGSEATDVWVDKSGRLLKIAVPSRGIVAVRDDPPPA